MPTVRRKDKRWQAMVRKGTAPPQYASFRTRAEAEAWAAEVERKIGAGEAWAVGNRTLGDILERYLADEAVKRKGSRWEKIRIGVLQRDALARVKTWPRAGSTSRPPRTVASATFPCLAGPPRF